MPMVMLAEVMMVMLLMVLDARKSGLTQRVMEKFCNKVMDAFI